MAKKAPARASERHLDARPDVPDFRDRMYEPTLVEVPMRICRNDYKAVGVPILDQGVEGACTGFGLAAVAHYLLRTRDVVPDTDEVSPRMFYESARRYDEWPGVDYSGSSARGAMKGWHKHGVCSASLWPYRAGRPGRLTAERRAEARRRPLGAYYRVNHKDLVSMHATLAEVGILYCTAVVHSGWDDVGDEGHIPFAPENRILGGHAFAIVAYDEQGFWLQNSWGPDWGADGFAHISYDDWLEHGTDVWVARLGVPVQLLADGRPPTTQAVAAEFELATSFSSVRPHIVTLGNDGALEPDGTYGNTSDDVRAIVGKEFPQRAANWKKRRLLLYAHGGLVDQKSAIQRVADLLPSMLEAEVYPLAFIWNSDYWTTLTNMLEDALRRRRPEGWLDATRDFMLDRLDDALEPLARRLTGKAQWDEMKENAQRATIRRGGADLVAREIAKLAKDDPDLEIHLVGHSAGGVFLAPLVQLLTSRGKIGSGPMKNKTGLGLKVASCTLWAPACTVELFKESFLPAIKNDRVDRFAMFTLTDDVEQDDHCADIYHKSLLYLVSNAFEAEPRIPVLRPEGAPILGMERFIDADDDLVQLFRRKSCDWVLAPNEHKKGAPNASRAQHHGDFDDDEPTLQATLARILQSSKSEARFIFPRSASSLRDQRRSLDGAAPTGVYV